MRILRLCVESLICLAVLLWTVIAVPKARAQDIAALQSSIVRVVAIAEGKRKTGAGFIVRLQKDRAFIATAAHVVEGAEQVEVEFFAERNRFVPARIVGIEGNDPNGVAALVIPSTPPATAKQLTLNSQLPVRAGDPIVTIGFPQGAAPYSVVRGEVAGRRGKTIDVAAAIDEGNSGGPLIKGNEAIGILLAARSPFAHALPAVILRYVLESWSIDTQAMMVLRSDPATVSLRDIAKAIQNWGFSHPGARLQGLPHGVAGNYQPNYETLRIEEDQVVVDHASGLIWEQSGSNDSVPPEDAMDHIEKLNSQLYAGANDWRLPTIEELASLLRPSETTQGVYASALFDSEKWKFWSSDTRAEADKRYRLGVDFMMGAVSDDSSGIARETLRWVRGVRSKAGS